MQTRDSQTQIFDRGPTRVMTSKINGTRTIDTYISCIKAKYDCVRSNNNRR